MEVSADAIDFIPDTPVSTTNGGIIEVLEDPSSCWRQHETRIIVPRALKEQLAHPELHKESRSLLSGETETDSVISSVSDPFTVVTEGSAEVTGSRAAVDGTVRLKHWNGKKFFSDMIKDGLNYLKKDDSNIVMIYENPSSSTTESSFYNNQVFNYHDYPAAWIPSKTILGPLRYSVMNGSSYQSYLKDAPPAGLIEHWAETVPGFVAPTFTHTIPEDAKVCAYLPIEQIKAEHHVNDPHVHYHLAGKDAIHLMTSKTTKLLGNTQGVRPCVAKVTHAMGSKGIFVIRTDEDEVELTAFLNESGHPNFVVTEFVDIARNVACHFFIHPSGEVTWFGSNENVILPTGLFSRDSTLNLLEQDELREMQWPYVVDVVKYCLSLGFWGSCGIDVLFDHSGQGYLVDVNPRVTGSCPALMIARQLREKYNFAYGLFRRVKPYSFPGTATELFDTVRIFNEKHEGSCRVVILSMFEKEPRETCINVAVYSHSMEECQAVLSEFAHEMLPVE